MINDETSAVESAVLSGVLPAAKLDWLEIPRPTANALRTAHATTNRTGAFTLAELLVSMVVLVLLVLLFTQLLNSAATITTLGRKQMDADSQTRELLDRMSVDFAKMVKRSDVDYYLKSSSGTASDCGVCGSQVGNDQAAFYTSTPGYYATVPAPTPSYTQRSSLSVVAYRVNSDSSSSFYNRMERMGKGLAWNGVSAASAWTPVVFLPQTIGGNQPVGGNWPSAVSSNATDSSYEVIGPQVFRFEYYYLLKGQVVSGTTYSPIFADRPWDTRISGHTNVSGMRDVTAIIADIAVIDPKSKVLADNSAQVPPPGDNITRLAGQLVDYSSGLLPGQLLANWRTTIDANSIGLPRPTISGIRVYERYFYLNQ